MGRSFRIASGAEPLGEAPLLVAATVGLAALLSIPAWVGYAVTMLLLLPLTRRPRSEQAPDYDDDPPAGGRLAPARPAGHHAGEIRRR